MFNYSSAHILVQAYQFLQLWRLEVGGVWLSELAATHKLFLDDAYEHEFASLSVHPSNLKNHHIMCEVCFRGKVCIAKQQMCNINQAASKTGEALSMRPPSRH